MRFVPIHERDMKRGALLPYYTIVKEDPGVEGWLGKRGSNGDLLNEQVSPSLKPTSLMGAL